MPWPANNPGLRDRSGITSWIDVKRAPRSGTRPFPRGSVGTRCFGSRDVQLRTAGSYSRLFRRRSVELAGISTVVTHAGHRLRAAGCAGAASAGKKGGLASRERDRLRGIHAGPQARVVVMRTRRSSRSRDRGVLPAARPATWRSGWRRPIHDPGTAPRTEPSKGEARRISTAS